MPDACVEALPSPITVPVDGRQLDSLLEKEWLRSNQIGAYASSTVVGCNTRRYHGLLVAATWPPVGRLLALSTVMEYLTVADQSFELAANEFAGAFAPRGFEHLREFRDEVAATFVYEAGGRQLTKQVVLADTANTVLVRYRLEGGPGRLRLWPFAALRDYHGLRRVRAGQQMTFAVSPGRLTIEDRADAPHCLHLSCPGASFQPQPNWWYRFCYRQEIARGQEGFEDLYTPGCFAADLTDGQCLDLVAWLDPARSVGFDDVVAGRARRLGELAAAVGPEADPTARRLAAATDSFLAVRKFPGGPPSQTILAGYPWFADWGRDAFIALPGLLLETGRHRAARQVFATFLQRAANGLIPNRFDDYGSTPHHNSIDATLWFVVAADRYLAATGDMGFWRGQLMHPIHRMLTACHDGADFGIHADADGLLTGGWRHTQLTWMDVALGGSAVTPRHGKPVEVNALWHAAHRIMARRCAGPDDGLAHHYADRAERIAASFARTFWNPEAGCLYDCITDGVPDASVRPNQLLAVSLDDCPLSPDQQASVLGVVRGHLLTPVGLRTLSPFDRRYRRRYGGSWESRDRAYHQGTVWAWLIGPYIDALLKIEGTGEATLRQAAECLAAFDAHLQEAGLGFVSEIFDGDPPHAPRGCIAQAWSVAEVLRAKLKVARLLRRALPDRQETAVG